jgi:hypothetical protein
MVLLRRIELPASPLPRVRSTTELQQHHLRGIFTLPENDAQVLYYNRNIRVNILCYLKKYIDVQSIFFHKIL